MSGTTYEIVFNPIRETEKAYFVQKKTKKIYKHFWVPKSIVINVSTYGVNRNLDKDLFYVKDRIKLELPKWYCDKELGFYK